MTAAGSEGIAVANIYAEFPDAVDVTPQVDVSVDLEGSTYLRWLHHTALVAGIDGYLVASRRVPTGKQDKWLSRSYPVGDLGAFDDFVEEYGELNIYARSTLLARPLAHEHERGGKHEPGWLTHYAADIDTLGGEHSEDNLPTAEQALAILATLPPVSALIESGGGYYAIWRLDQAYELHTEEQRERAEAIGLRLNTALNAHGFHVDGKCGDMATVTRPPGTVNHKYTPARYVHLRHIDADVVYSLDDLDGLLPPAPTPEPKTPTPPRNPNGTGSYADIFAERFTLADVLQADPVDRWHHVATNGTEERWLREGSTNAYSLKQFRESGVVYVHSDSVKARLDTDEGLTLYAFAERLNGTASGQLADMLHKARDGWKQRQPDPVGDWLHEIENTATMADTPATETLAAPTARPTLPDDFWTARPFLEHIQQAARSRLVAPTALLGHVLAYVAAYTPPTYCVPPYIGGNTPLSLFVAQVAHSGGGKSSPARVVDDLLPTLPTVYSLGSGEGLIETYLEEVEERVDGKKIRRKQQTRFGAVFHLDEGAALADMGNRKGSTIFPTLRSAWMGAPIGTANSSQDTRRQLDAAAYSLGVTFLFQPSKARPLFDDVDGGLPQRFLFIEPTDTDAPDIEPDWPGPLPWTPKALSRIEGRVTHHPLNYPAHVADTIRTERKQHLRGQLSVGPLDAHRNLHRLKIAGLFAILDGNRTDVTDDDWTLAGILLDYSDAVRASVLRQLSAEDTRKENAATAKAVTRNRVLSDAEEHRAFDAALRAVARKAAANAGQTFTRGDLSRAVASKHRQLVTMEDVISKAVEKGYLGVTADDRYTLGAKPI